MELQWFEVLLGWLASDRAVVLADDVRQLSWPSDRPGQYDGCSGTQSRQKERKRKEEGPESKTFPAHSPCRTALLSVIELLWSAVKLNPVPASTHLSNQLLKQWKWKTCPHTNLFGVSFGPSRLGPCASASSLCLVSLATISSRQITQLPPPNLPTSSSVASGYLSSIFRVALRYLMRSRTLLAKERMVA